MYMHKTQQNLRPLAVVMAIAMGMGGELHIFSPILGTIAIFDLVSYVIAVPILLQTWHSLGKHMRFSLKFGFAWTFASMIANGLHLVNTWYWAKCVSLACSSWILMSVAYLVLRKDARLYLWYLVGAGIGGWISLYHFRNGAIAYFAKSSIFGDSGSSVEFLMAKQMYPLILRGIFLGIMLPLFMFFRKSMTIIYISVAIYFGYYLLLHGGSRSGFGIFCASGIIAFFVSFMSSSAKRWQKNPIALSIILICLMGAVFGVYKHMAKSGQLNESERNKYEMEFGEEGRGVLKGRAGVDYAMKLAMITNGIGAGGHIRCHSATFNALACEGVVGFAFWLFFYAQCFRFFRFYLPRTPRFAVFLCLMILWAMWDAFGSPFGTRHKFFVLMSFIALCQDNPSYGENTVFEGMPRFNAFLRRPL